MSKQLGYFDDDTQRDYPDLNKCPDCETFFASDNCPLCGKTCPEEMRAGNRKPIKQKKRRSAGGNGRVTFVPWYHTTLFIVIMLFFQPIIGLILAWTGYWKKHWKILVTVLVAVVYLGGALFAFALNFIGEYFITEELPVNTDMSRAEYVETCVTTSVEELYRNAEQYVGEYVSLTVTVCGTWNDEYDYESDYTVYYECQAEEGGKVWTFLVRDYRQSDTFNLTVGDVITVYGQGGGNATIYNYTAGNLTAPCINMLYLELSVGE